MFGRLLALALIAPFVCVAALARTAEKSVIDAVVKHCVDEVRATGDKHFDAFYNVANGLVQNNANVYEQDELFRFDKCMAMQGYPLK
jgi:hypothetical protein